MLKVITKLGTREHQLEFGRATSESGCIVLRLYGKTLVTAVWDIRGREGRDKVQVFQKVDFYVPKKMQIFIECSLKFN